MPIPARPPAGDDPLLRYRLRAVRIGVQLTWLVLVVLCVYPLLGGSLDVVWPAYAALIAVATVGGVVVRLLPWPRLFAHGLGIPALYAWSILDIVLITVGIAMTGGAASPAFVLYSLTTVFFAAAYPRAGQAILLAFTVACFLAALAYDGWEVGFGFAFMRLSGLALVTVMASFLSRELQDQMRESTARAAALARVAAAARRMSTLDPERVLGTVADAAVDIGFDGAAICLFDESSRSWHTAQSAGLPTTAAPSGPLLDDVPGAVRSSGETLTVHHLDRHPSGLHALVACPMWSGGDLAGVLVAGRLDERPLRPYQVEAVELLAAQAGAALNNARLFDERRAFENRLAHQAFHDPLTDLPNRALFLDRLNHALTRRTRSDGSIAVLFLDLDRFKLVNDSLGHDAGDELLKLAGARLSACLRPGDTLARYGGDEFTVLLDEVVDATHAAEVADRLLVALASPFRIRSREVVLGASIGIAIATPGVASDPMREADLAMYRAKERGKGRWELFEDELNVRALRRLEGETELRRAIEGDELFLVYQPIVSLATGEVIGAEALARWDHPSRGVVAPSEFIPLAEELGLIVPLGEWVIETACRQAAAWRAAGVAPFTLSVNLAVEQFQSSLLPSKLADALERAGLPASALTLEITESMVMADAETALWVMGELRHLGVGLALDDFGQGYSSLSHLKRFPLQSLKVDKVFIDGVVDHAEDRAIVRSVITLARDLGISVTAEGIETDAQLAEVRRLGCDAAQGFLLSVPLPAEAVPDAVRGGRVRGSAVAAPARSPVS